MEEDIGHNAFINIIHNDINENIERFHNAFHTGDKLQELTNTAKYTLYLLNSSADQPVKRKQYIGCNKELLYLGNTMIIHIEAVGNLSVYDKLSNNGNMCGFDHIIDILTHQGVNIPAATAKCCKEHKGKESLGLYDAKDPNNNSCVDANTDEEDDVSQESDEHEWNGFNCYCRRFHQKASLTKESFCKLK